nr:hypothetical protein [Streptomyces sp. ST1015]
MPLLQAELPQQPLHAPCDLDEPPERHHLGHPASYNPAHRVGVGEESEGVRGEGAQGQAGLGVPGVVAEELAGHGGVGGDDVRGGVEAVPGEFGVGDEADAGERGVARAVVQGDEDAVGLDGGDAAGEVLAGGEGFQEGVQFGVGGDHVMQLRMLASGGHGFCRLASIPTEIF